MLSPRQVVLTIDSVVDSRVKLLALNYAPCQRTTSHLPAILRYLSIDSRAVLLTKLFDLGGSNSDLVSLHGVGIVNKPNHRLLSLLHDSGDARPHLV